MVMGLHATTTNRGVGVTAALVCLAPLLLGSLCGGDGHRGQKAVRVETSDPECRPLFGRYPPGLAALPDGLHAVVATGGPQTLIPFEVLASPPVNLGPREAPPFPSDSDGDGESDAVASMTLGFGARTPILGRITAISDTLVLASASNYEEVLAYSPMTSELQALAVATPLASDDFDPADHPFAPPTGETRLRTAVATRVCVRAPNAFDSEGLPIAPGCDADVPSFYTNFTAHQAVAGDLLVVATSNLASSAQARFRPGTLLLFEFDAEASPPRVAPLADRPVVFTTHFNPTSTVAWQNAHGRPLVLVGQTGAIALSTGAAAARTDSAIDVFDVASRRIAATIPLGPAGLDYSGLAIHAESGVAVAGSAIHKQIQAVDLAVLDDERLYQGDGAPVVLDGSDAVHPDARIFTGDAPLVIPRRAGGPDPAVCDGWTNVAVGPDRDGNPAALDVYVTDRCDGTLTQIDVDLAGANETPLDPSRFRIQRQMAIADQNVPARVGEPMEPNQLILGPAGRTPGAAGPHLYFLRNIPTADLCALHIDF